MLTIRGTFNWLNWSRVVLPGIASMLLLLLPRLVSNFPVVQQMSSYPSLSLCLLSVCPLSALYLRSCNNYSIWFATARLPLFWQRPPSSLSSSAPRYTWMAAKCVAPGRASEFTPVPQCVCATVCRHNGNGPSVAPTGSGFNAAAICKPV